MGIIQNALNRIGYINRREVVDIMKASGNQWPGWALADAGVEKWSIPDYSLYRNQAELYRRLSWVHTAVKMTAQTAAPTVLNVKKRAGEELEDIQNHPLEMLLQRPNPLHSRFEFLEATVAGLKLTGNAYWWLNRTSENSPPSELWIIESNQIVPVPDERQFLRGYLYDPGNGQPIALNPWEIVHFKTYNPFSQFVGLSAIEAFAVQAAGDIEAAKWNTKLFGENNGRLPGILAFADAINDTDWKKLLDQVADASAKRNYMMLRGTGAGDVKWMQAAATQKEMEFLAGREFTRDEIFGVMAPGLASMLAVNSTEASSKTGKATFLEFTVYPMLTSIGDKITNNLLPVYGDNLMAEFEDVRQIDRVLEISETAEYSRYHTVDEVRRRRYGSDPIGDERGLLLPSEVGAGVPVEGELLSTEMQPANEPDDRDNVDTAARAELGAWYQFTLERGAKLGRSYRCKHIDPDEQRIIRDALKDANTKADIAAIFRQPMKPIDDIPALVNALTEAVSVMRGQVE